MKPKKESIVVAPSAMPKDRRKAASTRGVEIAVQKPTGPNSSGLITSASSGTSTMEVR